MKKIRAWLSEYWRLIVVVLLLAIPLMIALRDVVRDVIVYPLARLFWLARLVFLSIPPVFIWGYFLLIAVRIIIHSVRTAPRSARVSEPEISSRQGRVSVWARRIRLTQQGDYSRWGLAHHLSELAARILASNERVELIESRHRLRAGEWEAPDEIRDYFRSASTLTPPLKRRRFLGRLWQWLFGDGHKDKPYLDLDVREVVAFLETRAGARNPGEQEP